MTTYNLYDSEGRVLSEIREALAPAENLSAIPAQTTTYTYDALGRMLSKTISSGGLTQLYTWEYNQVGRLVQEVTPFGTTVFGFVPANLAAFTGPTETRTVYAGNLSPAANDIGDTTVTTHYLDGGVREVRRNQVKVESHDFQETSDGIIEIVTKGDQGETVVSSSNAESASYVRVETNSGVVTRTYFDALGRPIGVYAGWTLTRSITYPSATTVVETLYASPDPDRTMTTTTSYQKSDNAWWRVTTQTRGATSETPVLISTQKEKLSGFGPTELSASRSVNALGGVTTVVSTVDPTRKAVVSTTRQDLIANTATQITRAGLLQAYNTAAVQIYAKLDYDGLGREVGRFDPLTSGTIVTTYDPVYGQIATAAGGNSDTIANAYYPASAGPQAGLLKSRAVNGLTTRYSYTTLGQLEHVWGSTYPLTYTYDAACRMKTLSTYQAEPASEYWFQESWPATPPPAALTTWVYWPGTPLLKTKLDAAGLGPLYEYDGQGRLARRTGARGVTTTYGYNLQGERRSLAYSDGTPSVSYARDAAGLVVSVTDGAGAHQLRYNAAGQLVSEIGLARGTALTHQYDALGRPAGYVFTDPASAANNASAVYSYDPAAGTMQQIQQGDAVATYGYDANGTCRKSLRRAESTRVTSRGRP